MSDEVIASVMASFNQTIKQLVLAINRLSEALEKIELGRGD